MFAYVDRISDILVEDYGTERERIVRGAAQLRGETVRAILAGEPIDEEHAVQRLGYELRRHHVALRLSSSASEVRGLERAAREAAVSLGPGEPLVIASGLASLDVWWGSYEPVGTAALERYEPPEGVRIAFGVPARDVAGFRRSHVEAVQAARVAALAGDSATTVTSYRRVELVSLLASDLPRARRFVAARSPGIEIRAGGAPARDRPRLPGSRRQRHTRGQGSPRASEHRDLSRQAGGGADGPAGQRRPG
jgi:DNA-binding PucR family transcriptional regulator